MFDNFLDVVSLVVQEAIYPGTAPRCDDPSVSTLDLDDVVHKLLYGTNNTVVVGLTETMFASTDGYNVVYYSTAKRVVRSQVAPGAWPIPVDVRMGIAAVRYGFNSGEEADDTGHGQTTSMMGCRCDDQVGTTTTTTTGMHITCAILHYDPGTTEGMSNTLSSPATSVFPVIFQVGSTASYMTCASTKINVESIRWPLSRFTSIQSAKLPLLNQLKGSDCFATGRCNQADAAIWVMPLCGGGGTAPAEVCYQAFASAACYPYCMGVRQSGSFNSVIRLYNAPNWWQSVHIFNMDCALLEQASFSETSSSVNIENAFKDPVGDIPSFSADITQQQKELVSQVVDNLGYGGLAAVLSAVVVAKSSSATGSVIETVLSNDWLASATTTLNANLQSYNAQARCISNPLATSTLPKSIFASLNGDYGEKNFRSTLVAGQPFLFAGDTVLTAECEDLDPLKPEVPPPCKVLVHRIYGSEVNQFTLVRAFVLVF